VYLFLHVDQPVSPRYAGNAMASTVIPPPRTRHWTRVEYERLVELGVFQPGERLELIDGLLVVREPQGSRHAATIRRVLAALRRALGDAWQIDSQLPIALDADSEPEPDVAVVPRDPGAYRDAHPSRAVLIVEVAETSYRIDREYKANLYARAGIPDCWIIDLAHDALEVHRDPEASPDALYGWRYRSVMTLRPPATVAPLAAPGNPIPVADLLA
jgi:Uma2 family endonuclease